LEDQLLTGRADEGKKLTLEHTIPASIVEGSGAREGWSQSPDRLAEELQQV
jgi:hypothetical protein